MRIFDSYRPGNRRINKALFGEYDMVAFDFWKNKRLVATRVVSLGRLNDWYAAFDLYGGIDAFRKIAQDDVIGLNDKDLEFMCQALHLKKEDTQCYIRKQLRLQHLNS